MLVVHEWLKDYIGANTPSAEQIAELLTFHAFETEGVEVVSGQTVIDVDILPNRASDCLCHRGIARELASITGTPLAHDPLSKAPGLATTDAIDVTIEDTNACPRFTASVMTGIEVRESPEWLRERLRALGQRPINNIVDATNYVMYAIGQPIHAYDADLFPQQDGKWQFGVRYAQKGETVDLIAEGGKDDERKLELEGSELLIVDGATDTPAGLAGVKGGRYAGVHAGTKNIIIEAAHFDPVITRKTARRLGIVIDASKRFENEPSRELPLYAQREVTELIADIAGGTYSGVVDVYPTPQQQETVHVEPEHVNRLLGLTLSHEEMRDILERIGATVQEAGDAFDVTGPWERTDLHIEEDYIEEIGRIHGYEHVAAVVPDTVPLREVNARQYYGERVRRTLIDLGFSEVITSSFRKKDTVQLANALASDKSYLRSSLVKNVTEALDMNAAYTDLLGTTDTRLFEIGTVFDTTEASVSEHLSLCLGVRLRPSGYSGKEDAILKTVTEAIDTVLGITIDWQVEKGVAEADFAAVLAALPVPTAYEQVAKAAEITYRPFSLYPAVARDISLWVQETVTADQVRDILDEQAGELRVRTTLFDEFTKDGRTSYAFRLVFQAADRTLTDVEVNTIMEGVYAAVATKEWEVR